MRPLTYATRLSAVTLTCCTSFHYAESVDAGADADGTAPSTTLDAGGADAHDPDAARDATTGADAILPGEAGTVDAALGDASATADA